MGPIHRRTVVLTLTAGALGSFALRHGAFASEGPAEPDDFGLGDLTFDSIDVTFDSTDAEFGGPLPDEASGAPAVDAMSAAQPEFAQRTCRDREVL